MPINYSIAMYSNPMDEDAPKKAYAKSQYTNILTGTVTLLFHPAKAKMVITPESNYPVMPDMQMLIVAKNRNGTPGAVYLSHNPSMTQFCEYAPNADWPKHLPLAASPASSGNAAGDRRDHDASFQAFLKEKREKEEMDGRLPFLRAISFCFFVGNIESIHYFC